MFRQNSSEAPFGPSNRWLPATASSLWEGFVPTFPRQRFSVTATIAPMRWLSRSLFRLANFSTPPTQQPRQNAAGTGWARAHRTYGEAQRRDRRKQAAATTRRLGSGGEIEAREASHKRAAAGRTAAAGQPLATPGAWARACRRGGLPRSLGAPIPLSPIRPRTASARSPWA